MHRFSFLRTAAPRPTYQGSHTPAEPINLRTKFPIKAIFNIFQLTGGLLPPIQPSVITGDHSDVKLGDQEGFII